MVQSLVKGRRLSTRAKRERIKQGKKTRLYFEKSTWVFSNISPFPLPSKKSKYVHQTSKFYKFCGKYK